VADSRGAAHVRIGPGQPGQGDEGLVIDPPYDFPPYRSTTLRHPIRPLVKVSPEPWETEGPLLGGGQVFPGDSDLTRVRDGEAIGERMNVSGRILDAAGRPVRNQLVEMWQANAAGRYHHRWDQHHAPIDPNFRGAGRCLTDDEGCYRFMTIVPGQYPWGNHPNAWRPAHLHFSVFGSAFAERLVTQMYFPGDPLMAHDPIFQSVRDPRARERLVAMFDWSTTEESYALGYHFDIVVSGRLATPRGQ
jgi:protocatechuate 3,4-dioxygenase beta subunit